jgi:hypothetical protein
VIEGGAVSVIGTVLGFVVALLMLVGSLSAMFGSPHKTRRLLRDAVERQTHRVVEDARRLAPRDRGRLLSSIGDRVLWRKANGEPAIVHIPGPIRHEDSLAYELGFPADVEWRDMLPIQLDPLLVTNVEPEEAIARVREMFGGCAHRGEVEVSLSATGETVAWWCPDCDGRRYAAGW